MYNIDACMFINVSWMQQYIPLPLQACAPLNRATSSVGGSFWCRSPPNPHTHWGTIDLTECGILPICRTKSVNSLLKFCKFRCLYNSQGAFMGVQ